MTCGAESGQRRQHRWMRSLRGRCLQKNLDRRLQDIADAQIEIEEGSPQIVVVEDERTWSRTRI